MSENAMALARELLLGQRLHGLVIEPEKLRYDRRIVFSSYAEFCRRTMMSLREFECSTHLKDGCTIISRGSNSVKYIVLYNEKQRYLPRRRFTLAHEIGHIYLNHIDDGRKNETEANSFASEFLMPSALVRRIYLHSGGKVTPRDLSAMFGVSVSAAASSFSKALKTDHKGYRLHEKDILRKYGRLIVYDEDYIVDI